VAPDKVTRRLAAIFAADMVGYSRLMEADEEGTIARHNVHRSELIDPKIAEHDGRIVKTTGDGMLVEFASVVDAVRCAVEVQQALAEREADVPDDRRIQYRVGINLGDIVIDDDDILGDGVNVAARLEGAAEPGGVCVSEAVFKQVDGKVPVAFEDRGEQRFKNIATPIRMLKVQIGNAAVPRIPRLPAGEEVPPSEKPSIAILPFENLSTEPEYEFFADGLRLDIQATLVKARGLFLIATQTTGQYRGSDLSAEQAGSEMGARYVLEGAVQRAGSRIRVTVRLTDIAARQVIWAERYDREIDDLLMIQDDITVQIITALDLKLAVGEQGHLRHTLTNLEAVEQFYQGLSLFYAGSKETNAASRVHFERTAELQPDSPVGPSYVCFSHWLDAFRGWSDQRQASLDQATKWAERAASHPGANGLEHIVLASNHLFNGRHDDALAACQEAVARRPSCPSAHGYMANVLHFCGKASEAVSQIKEAIRVTPVYPPWLIPLLAAAYREAGTLDRSIAVAEHAVRMQPKDIHSLAVLCSDYVRTGRENDAQTVAGNIIDIDPDFSVDGYLASQPYRDPRAIERLAADLNSAGLGG
jgi:adenylate cyclase